MTLWKRSIIFLSAFAMAGVCLAWTNLHTPAGAIEYAGGTFSRDASTSVLKDVTIGNSTHFFNNTVTELTQIVGYAHFGNDTLNQQQANQRVAKIQVWGWRDTNGNGAADEIDAKNGSTRWILLSEISPSASAGDGTGGNVIGYAVTHLNPQGTTAWADILQRDKATGDGIQLQSGEAWLLLLRVIGSNGCTNLVSVIRDGSNNITTWEEQWDDGDTSNGIGSDFPSDKYITADGKTPGTGVQRFEDQAVVSIYVAKR